MADLTVSANVDTLMQAANYAAFRTSLGLTALATTTPGTGVATALAVNIGSAGAPILFNGAAGTPSSLVGTNITGTAAGLTAGTASAVAVGGITGLGAGVGTFLATPSGANLATALTTALPASKGGTGLTSLGSGVTTLLGATLTDPGADRILFWDDSAGAFTYLTVGSGLTVTDTTITATGGGSGDVTAASNFGTTDLLIRSDGTGKGVQASGITIDDSDNITGVEAITTTTVNATTLLILDNVDQSHGLSFVVASDLAANRTLTLTTGDANRAITLTGDLAMSGAFNITLTSTANTNVTLPTTGTLATLGGVETLTNKSLPITVKTTASNYTIGTTSALELYGGVIYVTAACTLTIPAVTAGQSFTVITVGAVAVSVDPNASDLIMLDGVALSDGDSITNLSTSGDIAVFTYYDATGWYAATNGWTDTN